MRLLSNLVFVVSQGSDKDF